MKTFFVMFTRIIIECSDIKFYKIYISILYPVYAELYYKMCVCISTECPSRGTAF